MISEEDKEKLKRVSELEEELSGSRILILFLIPAALVVMGLFFVVMFLFTGRYEADWVSGALYPGLALLTIIIFLHGRKNKKAELRRLREEAGL